jgi:hypothetical protein
MITIASLIGQISALLIYTAVITLGCWLAGHFLRAVIIYVPKVKMEESIPFRISYWFVLISLALAALTWAFLVLTHLAAPNSWWGQQTHWVIPIITAFYLLPVALAWAVWNWQALWVRFGVASIALLYLAWCWITVFYGWGFFFSPAALFLVFASAFRVFAPPSAAANARAARRIIDTQPETIGR